MVRRLIFLSIVFSFFVLLFAAGVTATNCWNYDDNQTACELQNDCIWEPDDYCGTSPGCCDEYECWLYDGNQSACENAINTLGLECEWEPNDLNQNPWCPDPVGCCDMIGCWDRDGTNESYCEDPTFMDGICKWTTQVDDPWCINSNGCCIIPWCGETSMQNETKCKAAAEFSFPCYWDGNNCIEQGCNAFHNNTEECMNLDWCEYNYTSDECYDPWMDGGFFDDFNVHCWFADFQPTVCLNITGCVYCNDTGTHNNVNGMSGTGNESSACYNNQVGWCQGHENFPGATDIAQDVMECEDILLKQICNFGPLQGCKWNASEANVTIGQYCVPGLLTDTEKDQFKPIFNGTEIKFCDDPLIVNNQTFCNQLKNTWFMPCKWNSNTSSCKFDWESTGFGDAKGGDLDFYDIMDEDTCVMAGGKWIKEQFCSGGSVQIESWCEMGVGKGYEQCDDACWACEWQNDGTDWPDATSAQSACVNSALGFCAWEADSYAPNGYGWCDPAGAFEYGGGSCSTNCADCNAMNDPQTACGNSAANCEYVTVGSDSWCQGANMMTCSESCDKCFDSESCKNTGPGCTWDTSFNYCKASGGGAASDAEVCFDGVDNDDDNKIDCGDPDCSFDDFCGGAMMGDCHFYDVNTSCEAAPSGMPGKNCTWVETDWNETWCGFPGENCWMYEDNETACTSTSGCGWVNFTAEGWDPFCEINWSKAEPCFQISDNSTECNNNALCTWVSDPWCQTAEGQNDPWCQNNPDAGWCDFFMFAECFNISDPTTCNANPNCWWTEFDQGWCDPICFSYWDNLTACQANSNCQIQDVTCEPEMFAANCWQYDGNQTACNENNATCMYFEDEYGPDVDGVGGEPAGYCDPKGDMMMFMNMDPSPPIHLGSDLLGDATPSLPEIDIEYFGLKEMGDAIGFGAGVDDIQNAAACNGYYVQTKGDLGKGQNTTKFYLYLDTDGSESGGCAAYDQNNNAVPGFEFKMSYVSEWDTSAQDNVSGVKTFYKCSSGAWSVVAVPLFVDKPKMCNMLGGLMIGIQESDLEQFSEYDDTIPMRIFIATADATHNATVPSDSAASSYYTPGTIDFKFECCDCPGQDMDGDGLVSEEDPDCLDFKKYGYVPKEDCWSSEDDDNDGLTNCADQDCMWEPKCENDPNKYDPSNDKEAPKVIWHKVEVYPDGAFIMYDSNEPANGTVEFYGADSTCQTLNKTIRDIGIIDTYMPEFKDWHDGPIDNFQFNPDKLGYDLINGTTYYYRLKLCDMANNCGISACTNFTTAKSSSKADCPACNPTFAFTPPPGVGFAFDFGAGWEAQGGDCGGTGGVQMSYNQTKKINIKINSSDGWEITLVNVTIPANLPDAAKLFESTDLKALQENSFVGMTKEKWEQLKAAGLKPEWIRIKFQSLDCSSLWHCNDDLNECQQIDTESGVTLISSSGGWCEWQVPPTWGFSTYGPSDASSSGGDGGSGGGGSSGGGGAAGGGAVSTKTTTEAAPSPTPTTQPAPQPAEAAPTEEAQPPAITGAAVAEVIQQPAVQAGTLIAIVIILFAAFVYYRRHHYTPPRLPRAPRVPSTYKGRPSYGGRYLRVKRK